MYREASVPWAEPDARGKEARRSNSIRIGKQCGRHPGYIMTALLVIASWWGPYVGHASADQTLGLSATTVISGVPFGWGRDDFGQLGMPPTARCPARGPCVPTPRQVAGRTSVVALAGGTYHTLFLSSDGSVWAVGDNFDGELGNGTLQASSVPVRVMNLANATAIAAGDQFSVALKSDGSVWSWGSNYYGALGTTTVATGTIGLQGDSTVPVQVSGLSGIIAIAAGADHALALKSDGTVWAWGRNDDDQLGAATAEACQPSYPCSDQPLQVQGLSAVTAIAGGTSHSLAVTADGAVWAWGSNLYGQLGASTTGICNTYLGPQPCSETPLRVGGISGVTAVAGGMEDSAALKSDGTVWSWGANVEGDLGAGTFGNYTGPVQAVGLSGVSALAIAPAYGETTVALRTDGTVWAWGSGYYGELGTGSLSSNASPAPVPGLTHAVAVASGDEDALAIQMPTQPALLVDPYGGAYRQTITAAGDAFGPHESVNLYWDTTRTPPLTTTTTAADGSFVTTFLVPQAVFGAHTLVAVGQTSGVSATVTVSVRPRTILVHTTGTAGSTNIIIGYGFGPHETVQPYWKTNGGVGKPLPLSATAK